MEIIRDQEQVVTITNPGNQGPDTSLTAPPLTLNVSDETDLSKENDLKTT